MPIFWKFLREIEQKSSNSQTCQPVCLPRHIYVNTLSNSLYTNPLLTDICVTNIISFVNKRLAAPCVGRRPQKKTGTPFNERTGVAGGFWPGNLLRTPQKGFLLTKTRGKENFVLKKKSEFFFVLTGGTLWKSKKKSEFFPKKNHLCPAFSSIKSFFEGSWASFRVKNHPHPMSVH